MRFRTRSVGLTVAVAILALVVSQGASCGQHPKHNATLSLNAFAKGLAGVQNAELVLFQTGKVPQATHVKIQGEIAQVATLADQAQTVLDAWVPGQPVPKVLGTVMQAAKTLMQEIVALIPVSSQLQAQIDAVYGAIADVLVLMAS